METSESATIASASQPVERSRRLSQPAAVARPSARKARAPTSARNAVKPLTSRSGGPEPLQRRDLAGEELDHLGVPLAARAGQERGRRLLGRAAGAVRPVVDHRVEGVAHRDDPGQPGDLPAAQAVRVAAAVEVLVVVSDDRKQAGAGMERADDALADRDVGLHAGRLDRTMLSPIVTWACMRAVSTSSSGPGLSRIESGTPILPMSWMIPPRYRVSRANSGRP